MGTRQRRTPARFALFAMALSVVAASLLAEAVRELEPPYRPGVVAVLALAVIASSYHPLKIIGRSGEMTSDMDHAALIATAFVLPLHHALLAFALGEACSMSPGGSRRGRSPLTSRSRRSAPGSAST